MSSQNSDVINRGWVEQMLSQPEFVEWDRFTQATVGGEQRLDVYGWIEREHDEYKDFVLLCLWPEDREFEFTTSSARYSDDLYRLWRDADDPEDHYTCQRVENNFGINNATTLDSRDRPQRGSQ